MLITLLFGVILCGQPAVDIVRRLQIDMQMLERLLPLGGKCLLLLRKRCELVIFFLLLLLQRLQLATQRRAVFGQLRNLFFQRIATCFVGVRF